MFKVHVCVCVHGMCVHGMCVYVCVCVVVGGGGGGGVLHVPSIC